MNHSAAEIAASKALFARASRNADQVVVPLGESGVDQHGEAPALFCIHSIVGAVGSDFLALARSLEGSVRTFGIQVPRRWMRDESFEVSVHALADIYAREIAEAQPSGALVVAGWSAGAALAIEVAHCLAARGRKVALVVAIDGAPENLGVRLRAWDPRYWLGVARSLPWWLVDGVGAKNPAELLLRCGRGLVERVKRLALRRAPRAIPALDPSYLNRYPAAERRFMVRLYDAIMGYAPRPWDGPVVLYQARAVLSRPEYLWRCWRSVAPLAERTLLAGNHVTILSEPRVAVLARELKSRMARALSG